jgi:hypothetical protein
MASARQRCARTDWVRSDIRAAASTAEPKVRKAAEEVCFNLCMAAGSHGVGYNERFRAEAKACAGVFLEVIGNPFQPVTLHPSWLAWHGGAVPNLARSIYDERAFERLPVLADALEEAGCDNADVLGHCRSGGEHVRGCWVVDLLLGLT